MIFSAAWFLGSLVVLVAATLQAVTGFGFSLLAIPMLMMIFDPKLVIGINMFISVFAVSMVTYRNREYIVKPLVKNLFLGAIIAIPLGGYIYRNFNLVNLKLLVGCIVVLLSVFLLTGIKICKKSNPWIERGVGSFSGILTSSVGMPGPPIILFLNDQGLDKQKFRATIAMYFNLVFICTITMNIFTGLVTLNIFLKAISFVPFAMLGNIIGSKLFFCVPQKYFQRGVTLFLLVLGTYIIISNI